MASNLPAKRINETLPPILAGRETPTVRKRVEEFFNSVEQIFESWVKRCNSPHTQRAYRQDLMSFLRFCGIDWPQESLRVFAVSVTDVQACRDELRRLDMAPKTVNRRVASISSFYKYLAAGAAEMRLPITVPNPAHSQFIAREASDPKDETKALSASRARQLMNMPSGDSLVAYRDRAILKLYLYSGIRLSTGCRLKVSDFHQDGDAATIRLHEKGDKRRTIGIHYAATQAVGEYVEAAGITSVPLFRPLLNPRSKKLASRAMDAKTMYRVILSYLERLPAAVKETAQPDGSVRRQCIYTPHSLRATTATLLLIAGVDIRKVQELLGHRHVTTTQIYDKRRRSSPVARNSIKSLFENSFRREPA